MLIIASTGYSGTKFVAQKLDIEHEPRTDDYRYFWDFVRDPLLCENYIQERFTGEEQECNSNLLPHIDAIEYLFPECEIQHLVRNPYDTIRSFMSGTLFSSKDSRANAIKYSDEKQRFIKCVDWWVEWHTKLDKYELLRLEDLKGEPINQKPHSFPIYEEWEDWQKNYLLQKADRLIHKYDYRNYR